MTYLKKRYYGSMALIIAGCGLIIASRIQEWSFYVPVAAALVVGYQIKAMLMYEFSLNSIQNLDVVRKVLDDVEAMSKREDKE